MTEQSRVRESPVDRFHVRHSPVGQSRIRLLPETTVNRIAAGEVIERPAAAVKELVENALDAGAQRISVVLAGGGIDRIEVTDDGSGMTAEELGLCVLRHATSKLADDNLIRIDTLGFRGEALPSIGAAARLEITSRPRPRTDAATDHADPGHACSITVEGGAVGLVEPAAGPPGTRIVVRDLFFATPARRKFLKNPRTEAEHAEAVVRRLAMAAPATAFRLENEGRVVFDLPAQERAPRVAALLGAEAAGAMLPVRETRATAAGGGEGEMVLSGYMCAPAVSRMTGAAQGLVVNGRPVADPVLKTAVRVAYRDVIAHGRHPVVALWLDLPPAEIDVNVHPAKTELRFRDPAAVRSLVIGALGRVLAGAAGTSVPGPGLMQHRPSSRLAWSRPSQGQGVGQGGIRSLPLPGFTPAPAGWSGVSESVTVPEYGPEAGTGSLGTDIWPVGATNMDARRGFQAGLSGEALDLAAAPAARTMQAVNPDGVYQQRQTHPMDYPLGAAVAQVLNTYIIAVAADGTLILVDQHAAHERLTHEAIRTRMLDGGVAGQPLLLPAVVDLTEADARRLLARADDLALLGLEIESFGSGAILVRALPAALGAPEPAPLIRDIADELAELDETMALPARLDAVIARMACHGSIRAGRRLRQAEMDALLRQMEATPRAATCSHGRPTFLKLSKAEIETLFGRR